MDKKMIIQALFTHHHIKPKKFRYTRTKCTTNSTILQTINIKFHPRHIILNIHPSIHTQNNKREYRYNPQNTITYTNHQNPQKSDCMAPCTTHASTLVHIPNPKTIIKKIKEITNICK